MSAPPALESIAPMKLWIVPVPGEPYAASLGFAFAHARNSASDLTGRFGATASANGKLHSVDTGMKSMNGS
jgi:hypothetical protein